MEVKKFYRLKCHHGGHPQHRARTDGLLDEIMK